MPKTKLKIKLIPYLKPHKEAIRATTCSTCKVKHKGHHRAKIVQGWFIPLEATRLKLKKKSD